MDGSAMIEHQNALDLVAVTGVSRSYRQGRTDIDAVKSASCSIRPAARIAVMGASGSGKSTLLHLMAGLDRPSSGRIQWPAFSNTNGLVPEKISVAFQAPSLVPFLSVVENVALPLFVLGSEKEPENSAFSQLSRFGLVDLADKLPEELSGGQAQRVALARAMASEPRLLLADEPTGQLDHSTGSQVIATLIAWAEGSGCALMVATHDGEVARAFDEVWHMEHGHLTTTNGGARL